MDAPPEGPVTLCYSCRRTGVCRLGLTEERLVEPDVSLTLLTCGAEHEGGPGVAHGGWTAAAMDEALGHLNILAGQMAVTATLTVDYLRPVPIERPLEIRARLEKVEGGRRFISGDLTLASTGTVLARGRGEFVERDASHFERFQRWLASQTAEGS